MYIIVNDLGDLLLKVMWRTIPARVLLLALAKQGDSPSGSRVGGGIFGRLKNVEKEVKCIIFTLLVCQKGKDIRVRKCDGANSSSS